MPANRTSKKDTKINPQESIAMTIRPSTERRLGPRNNESTIIAITKSKEASGDKSTAERVCLIFILSHITPASTGERRMSESGTACCAFVPCFVMHC